MSGIDPNRAADPRKGDSPATPNAKVSVIVPHYEDLAGLDLCLDALDRQTYPREAFEIIVADNASPAGAEAVAATIAGRARLVVAPEKGAGPARNAGAALATGAILAFTDSDCRPEPDWLAHGVDALSEYDFVGGRMKVLVAEPRRMTATEAFEVIFAFDNKSYVLRKGFTVTANLLCHRNIFRNVGVFRTELSEDIDWCHRALNAGYQIGYAPNAIVGHPARKTWAELKKKWLRTNRELYILNSGTPIKLTLYAMKSLLIPLSAIYHTPKALLSDRNLRPVDKLLALVVLYRIRFWRFSNSLELMLGHGRHPAA